MTTANPWRLCEPDNRAIIYDVSHWQGMGLRLDECAKLGVEGLVAKFFHGKHPVASGPRQLAEGREAGFKILGRYVWMLGSEPVEAQVDAWCEDPPGSDELPLVIDAEDEGIPVGKRLELLERAVPLIVARTGRLPEIYSYAYWLTEQRSSVVSACPFWLASYPRTSVTGTRYQAAAAAVCGMPPPKMPALWKDAGAEPILWQFDGDRGLYLPSGMDVDVSIGDRQAMYNLIPARSKTDPAPAPTHDGPATPIGWAERRAHEEEDT